MERIVQIPHWKKIGHYRQNTFDCGIDSHNVVMFEEWSHEKVYAQVHGSVNPSEHVKGKDSNLSVWQIGCYHTSRLDEIIPTVAKYQNLRMTDQFLVIIRSL